MCLEGFAPAHPRSDKGGEIKLAGLGLNNIGSAIASLGMRTPRTPLRPDTGRQRRC